jgi:hypothetical protein
MDKDRYRPRFDEIEHNGLSLINEPLSAPDGTTALPVCYRERPLHAVLCESLKQTVPRGAQREVVRLLYVATRNQVKALAATLELEGLE